MFSFAPPSSNPEPICSNYEQCSIEFDLM